MSKTLTSSSITFIDTTDNRKLDAYITSNLPTIQIYDTNANTYSPDWSKTNLVLTADIYLDSKEVTDNTNTVITWFSKNESGEEKLLYTGKYLTITSNDVFSNNTGIITYICQAIYQGILARKEINFTRVNTGKDGTSVNIRGNYDTFDALKSAHPTGNIGDAYLINGDLYVWSSDDLSWVDVGNIQGPEGKPGESAKSIILSADTQVFKIDKNNVISPTKITVTAQSINTTATSWTYSTNGGLTFLSTVPNGVIKNGNEVVITGANLASNSLVIRASNGDIQDTLTIYKAFDGTDGEKGNDGDPAPIVFLTNENITFGADDKGQIAKTTFSTNVVAYNGTTKVTPTIGTITGLPNGITVGSPITLDNKISLTFTIADKSTLGSEWSNNGTINIPITSPINTNLELSWSKVNSGATGAMGVGIKSTTVTYGVSDSASTQPADTSWQSTIPVVEEGKYLWTRTIIDYTDDTVADTITYTYAKQGVKGDTGSSGSSVTISSIQYQEGASATTAPTGTWSNSVVAVAEGKYLWTRTIFSDGKAAYGVAKQGIAGRGVSSIVEQYYQSTSATAQSGGSWSTTVPTWADGKYIWTRSVITYTDSTSSTTSPICITGQKGGTGASGVGISSVDVWYYQSSSATSLSGGSWTTTAPTWVDEKYIWTKTITTYTNNTTDETNAVCITGQKGSTGVGVKSVTEYYLATASSSGVTISTSGWTTTIQTITVDKKYLWNYEVITYTDNTTTSTSPIIIGVFGNTGNTGATGKGIKSVTEYYLASTLSSGVTTATTGWTTTMQTLTATNKYLWNYELITYTDNNTATINPVIIGVYGDKGDKGNQGDRGAGINSVTVTYGSSTSASTQPTSWQSTIPTVAEGSYLWTRTITDYTDDAIADTITLTYAKQGTKGDTGSAGSSVTVSSIQYQAGTSATTTPTGTWSNSVVSVAEGSYLWTKTTFSDGKVAYGVAKQGVSGSDAYTIMLTNESHIFAGNISSAMASSATTQVLAYKGSTSQSVTIVSVNGKTASTSSTATGITGLSFSCSALSGTSPTITFTCTTSFVSANGTIPIVISVGGLQFTKIFTYGIAFKGATGAQGSTGTAASLVNITPSAHYFKSTTGKDGTFTPDYIYLYPRFQTVTYSKWEYSIDGGATWVAASGANGLTIGTYNSIANTLRIAKTSTLYTDTVTSISFRCVSSNASVYDTVSIAKIYDVVDLQIGGRNLLLNTSFDGGINKIYNLPSSATSGEGGLTFNLSEPLSAGTEVAIRFQVRGLANINIYWMMTGGNNAQSVISKSKISTTEFSTIEQRYTIPEGRTLNSVFICTAYGSSTPGTDWFEIKTQTLKLELGNIFTDWSPAPEDLKSITFQLYAPKGLLITKDVPEVTLETFAYDGSQSITSGTFVWYSLVNEVWTAISGATGTSLILNKDSVLKSNVYKCEMTYKGKVYTATTTVEDKTDIYESIMCISSNATGNDCYWVLYTLVYSDTEEIDQLLGPISINAPSSPTSGDYWYAVDATNASVQLKKYNGTTWVNSTDSQSLSYYWDIVNDGSTKVPFGDSTKVQVVSCHDFTATATLVCEVSNAEDGLLTQSSLSLTDASDPIVSATEPTSMVDGQIWIKPNDNGTYFMSIWDATKNMWIANDMDKRTKVYSSRPSSYNVGDLWITASDTDHGSYLGGTLLQTDTTSTTYNASHWSPTLKYDQDLDKIKETLNDLSEYVNITSEGLRIGAKSNTGEISPFTSLFTSTELSFYQNSDKLLTLANNQLTAPRIVVEDDLEVHKTISLGNLKLTIEDNGSFSFAVTK